MKKRLMAFVVAVVLVVSAALSIFSEGTSVAHKVANAIVSPFEKVFTSIKNGVSSLWEAQTQYDELLAENEALRDEIRELEKLIGDAELYRAENIELRALLDIRQSYVDLAIDTATIIAWNDTNWASTFTSLSNGSISIRSSPFFIKANSPLTTANRFVRFKRTPALNLVSISVRTSE